MKRALKLQIEGAVNWRRNLEREQVSLNGEADRLARAWERLQFLERQILKAQAEGKDGFDDERYMVPRKPK